MTETLLTITGLDLGLWSSRGCDQSLEPIEQSKYVKRTINGNAHDLSLPQFRKYRSRVTCNDINAPAFDKRWPGVELIVDCIPELSYKTAGGSPGRTVVTGSSRTEGDYTFYRPQLVMLLTSWDFTFNEWGDETGWTMDLEEK